MVNMNENQLFDGITRTEYTISEGGYKIPYSDFDRPTKYYDKFRERDYTGDEYADMCKFKDKSTALFDKRWKCAKAVIDIVAAEVDINPESTDLCIYATNQNKNGELTSPLVERLQHYFDKSGDKVKLKKRIAELETQRDALRAVIRGEVND